jgi:hypothetical protein
VCSRLGRCSYERLRVFDSNADAAYAEMQLWRDMNQNGISEAGELSSLAEHGILEIDLTPTDATPVLNAEGNWIQRGAFVSEEGASPTRQSGRLMDVWLHYDPVAAR